jgi:hypothetical protein
MWKKPFMANLRQFPIIFLEGMRKTTKNPVRIAGL